MSGKEKARKHKQFCPMTDWVRRGISDQVARGQFPSNVHVLCAEPELGFFWGGGDGGGGEPGICDGRMPLSTGQTNTVLPKRCDTQEDQSCATFA